MKILNLSVSKHCCKFRARGHGCRGRSFDGVNMKKTKQKIYTWKDRGTQNRRTHVQLACKKDETPQHGESSHLNKRMLTFAKRESKLQGRWLKNKEMQQPLTSLTSKNSATKHVSRTKLINVHPCFLSTTINNNNNESLIFSQSASLLPDLLRTWSCLCQTCHSGVPL